MKILNLTQHISTPDQQQEGVFEPAFKDDIKDTLTFSGKTPTEQDINERAISLTFQAKQAFMQNNLTNDEQTVMLGGAPYFMGALEDRLKKEGIESCYAFSKQEIKEDGTRVFRHLGMLKAPNSERDIKACPEIDNIGNGKVLNLTQFVASSELQEHGVVEPSDRDSIKTRLNFNDLPNEQDLIDRATELANIAFQDMSEKGINEDERYAMIGGAPFFLSELEGALREQGITPVYSYSERDVQEINMPDGSVEKKATFVHKGFVEGQAYSTEREIALENNLAPNEQSLRISQ